jgi:putative FmdB family regulatory protein
MARYDYKCSKCEYVFEVTHSIHDEPKVKCEKCKAISTRQISNKVYLYGTVGVDWNTNPNGASESLKKKARKASKRKQQF